MNALWAMVWNGFREARRNRVTVVVGGFALVLMLSTQLVTQVTVWTFDRVLTDFGLGLMAILLSALAIYLSCGLLAREIERRTIFLVVTRPVSRARFLVARLLGNLLTLGLLEAAMVVVFVFELKLYLVEMSQPAVASVVGLFFELGVLSAAGFFFSTWSSQFVSALCTTGLYFVGHFSGDIYRLGERSSEAGIKALTRAVYFGLPNLERFNFRPMAAYALPVPWEQVGSAALYALGWVVGLTVAATFIFDRRDFR
jgi:Cu-processing system permease protein